MRGCGSGYRFSSCVHPFPRHLAALRAAFEPLAPQPLHLVQEA